jgi:hypothetical protein
MTGDAGHPAMEHLARMRILEPDAARAARTRQRCQAMLRRRAESTIGAPPALAAGGNAPGPMRLRPTAVAAFCVLCAVYVGGLVATAVRVLGR